jgi:hypothetical protein
MNDEIRQITPEDPEVDEEWERKTNDPNFRDVDACRAEWMGGWEVGIAAQELFRQDPLGLELRQRVQSALEAVSGVTGVEEHDNETWLVTGNPSGEALMRAAANVVDDLADRMREAIPRPPGFRGV